MKSAKARGLRIERPDGVDASVDLARREISAMAALALLGGAAITIMGCGGGGSSPTTSSGAPPSTPSPTPTPAAASGDKVGHVTNDPRHSAVITAAQLAAGGALTLDIRGTAPHNHTVELSAQEVESIRNGQRVDKDSSTNANHSHLVIFS